MSRETNQELQDLIERGRRCIVDIRRFLADSDRRRNIGSPARRCRSSRTGPKGQETIIEEMPAKRRLRKDAP